MFSGVAAARVMALFKDARESAPSIVFIDEIDAIGKARTMDGFKDVGILDREQGLIQLLVEMDGFTPSERVLVIGATNRRDVLDPALLRPGRFDRTIHMGNPTVENRLKILEVHVREKQVPRGQDDAFLREVARKAVGYSGAELANLLNEAAILQVRSCPTYAVFVGLPCDRTDPKYKMMFTGPARGSAGALSWFVVHRSFDPSCSALQTVGRRSCL